MGEYIKRALYPAVDLMPIFGKDTGEKDVLKRSIADDLGVTIDDILSFDLYLTAAEKPTVWGDGFINAPHLDDLACVYGLFDGFLKSTPNDAVSVLAVFHGEEVGSALSEGANSTFLSDTLARVSTALGTSYEQMLARSFMVSADNAHALHPNHPELADGNNAPLVNGGVVVKFNANLR